MVARKIMYFALVSDWNGFRIVAVTTEKQTQIYGSVDGEPTHCRISDIKGRFPTREAALAVLNPIKAVIQKYAIEHKKLNLQMNDLHLAEHAEIAEIIKNDRRAV